MTQLSLTLGTKFSRDAYAYGERASGEVHGVVLTKSHIVELILDLAGYTPDRDLASIPLLEPSCGEGAFLGAAIARLLESARKFGRDASELGEAIAAFDVDPDHVEATRLAVRKALVAGGVKASAARRLSDLWVHEADFLLAEEPARFGAVVGNPPYVRIEQVAPALQAEYRARFETIFDRADLYVAFIEHGLRLLRHDGVLSFICADRWTLNRYGAPLRRLISQSYRVRTFVDLHQAAPFESEVIAYPAIFALSRGKSAGVEVAKLQHATEEECALLRRGLRANDEEATHAAGLTRYAEWFAGDAPWTISSPEHLALLRELEGRFAPLEADGSTRVGIGVATGNDHVFIVREGADIEPDRLVPLLMRDDINLGAIRDSKRFVINAFRDDGSVIDLREFPRLARYLETHSGLVRSRHVSKKNPHAWFRTIDRVYPALVQKPKLLIPDIAGSNEVAFDAGRFHPHHNLYFVTSDKWDLELLGALLSSTVALFFVWSYAVKMRGKYLRFQAQYLRRIRVPSMASIPNGNRKLLVAAFRNRDFAAIDELALSAYGLEEFPNFDFVDTRK